jgi:sugar phosphate isomerase/epimerase
MMHLSVLLPSFAIDFAAALRAAVALEFTHVDVVAVANRHGDDLEALADSGLTVSCAAIGKGMPEGETLDAEPLAARRAALDTYRRHLDDAALLGATTAYLVPGLDRTAAGLLRFTDACRLLADHAAARRVRLCVEHVPGRALAEVRQVLDWLRETRHAHLHLLLDIGHCLMTREDAAAGIRAAGPLLGHVHLDDNDAEHDLHLPLLAGRLTEADLDGVVATLRSIQFDGGLTLELSPSNPDPVEAVRTSMGVIARRL